MMRMILPNLSLLLVSVVAARAGPIIKLDFEGLQVNEQVLGYYNGGFGSMGTGPGPNFGITFTNNFVTLAIVPTGILGTRVEELAGTSGIMDVLSGVSGTFSFYYTNSGPAGTVNLYSGLDGTGSLVGIIPLPAQAGFTPAGVFAAPLFQSAIFTGTANTLVFDNITFGLFVVPEPSSLSLLFIGLLALWCAFTSGACKRGIARVKAGEPALIDVVTQPR